MRRKLNEKLGADPVMTFDTTDVQLKNQLELQKIQELIAYLSNLKRTTFDDENTSQQTSPKPLFCYEPSHPYGASNLLNAEEKENWQLSAGAKAVCSSCGWPLPWCCLSVISNLPSSHNKLSYSGVNTCKCGSHCCARYTPSNQYSTLCSISLACCPSCGRNYRRSSCIPSEPNGPCRPQWPLGPCGPYGPFWPFWPHGNCGPWGCSGPDWWNAPQAPCGLCRAWRRGYCEPCGVYGPRGVYGPCEFSCHGCFYANCGCSPRGPC